MNNTVAIFSSSRSNGNTRQLLDSIADQLSIDIVDLADSTFSEFDYEHKNQNDDFLPLMEKILEYENIIFASPVYWYSVTPTMKKFLDRISDLLDLPSLLDTGRRLRGKTGYVVCSSISEKVSSAYITAFEDTFEYLGMIYGGYIHANCDEGYQMENYTADIATFTALFRS